jgi:hypothetical protein
MSKAATFAHQRNSNNLKLLWDSVSFFRLSYLLVTVARKIAEGASSFAEWNPRLQFLVAAGLALSIEEICERR